MPKVSINLLRWNTSFEDIVECADAILAQTFQDFELIYMDNSDTNKPRLADQVRQKYANNPKIRVIDNGANFGYAGGHNKFFAETSSELLMVINPDAILDKDFLANIIPVFYDPKVGAATGKMLKPQKNEKDQWVLDGTGIVISKSRRAVERGQMEIDRGIYDNQTDVFGVSGTAAVYRRSALEKVKINGEYFDPDFFAYWEDLDLSWRIRLAGYECKYVQSAIVYHQRYATKSAGGYAHPIAFIKHHSKFSVNVRRWNWRNHLFAIIKNDFGWNFWKGLPFILARETAMLAYIILFEPKTLGALPSFFKLLPKMLAKRKIIQQNKVITSRQAERWFK